jgi:hypothetical protein
MGCGSSLQDVVNRLGLVLKGLRADNLYMVGEGSGYLGEEAKEAWFVYLGPWDGIIIEEYTDTGLTVDVCGLLR